MAFAAGFILIFGVLIIGGLMTFAVLSAFAAAAGAILMIKRNVYLDVKRKYMTVGGTALVCLGCLGFLFSYGALIFLGPIIAAFSSVFAAAVGAILMIKRNVYLDIKRKCMTIGGTALVCLGCLGFISIAAHVGGLN